MKNDPIVLVGMARTPQGNLLGELKDFSAPQLGSSVIKAALERSRLKAEELDEVFMGCVLPAGQGQAPARRRHGVEGDSQPRALAQRLAGAWIRLVARPTSRERLPSGRRGSSARPGSRRRWSDPSRVPR